VADRVGGWLSLLALEEDADAYDLVVIAMQAEGEARAQQEREARVRGR
jgi:hypothetical protein